VVKPNSFYEDLDDIGTVTSDSWSSDDNRLHEEMNKKASQKKPVERVMALREPASAEELNLVQHLFFLHGLNGPGIVVFCGVEPEDGSASVCTRTGEILATLAKKSVCLIDADLHSPSMHWRYCLENTPGFADTQPESWADKARQVNEINIWVLPAGIMRNHHPVIFPANFCDCMQKLRQRFRYILIEAPPLALSAEGAVLGKMADGVVLVVKSRSTRRAGALKARRNLEVYDVRLLGAVLNHSTSRVPNILPGKFGQ
jgi:Mrp family chromosome partitioning ATPase